MMRFLLSPNDWLARRQWLCLALIGILVCVTGGFGG